MYIPDLYLVEVSLPLQIDVKKVKHILWIWNFTIDFLSLYATLRYTILIQF